MPRMTVFHSLCTNPDIIFLMKASIIFVSNPIEVEMWLSWAFDKNPSPNTWWMVPKYNIVLKPIFELCKVWSLKNLWNKEWKKSCLRSADFQQVNSCWLQPRKLSPCILSGGYLRLRLLRKVIFISASLRNFLVQTKLQGGHPHQVQPQGGNLHQAQNQGGHPRQVQGSFFHQVKVKEGLYHQVQLKRGLLQAQFQWGFIKNSLREVISTKYTSRESMFARYISTEFIFTKHSSS